jgi:hypothetical protein
MSESDPRTQSRKFSDLARELECDDEDAFDGRQKKLAPKTPPKDALQQP